MLKPLPPPWDRFVPMIQKFTVWALFFAVLWVLRPFFFLVFLTFVFGYIMEHMVEKMEHRLPSRRVRVMIAFLGLLLVLLGLGWAIAPSLTKQVKTFSQKEQVQGFIRSIDTEIDRLRARYDTLKNLIPEDVEAAGLISEIFGLNITSEKKQGPHGEEALVVSANTDPALAESSSGAGNWKRIFPRVIAVLGQTIAIGSAFLLSLLFSLLIVLDFPKLAKGAQALHNTRIRFVYDEVSDSIAHFGRTLGRALEAQLMIAILNTALTSVGLSIMGFPNLVFLSCIVFVCSFIPVVGVFLSSVPICLQALTISPEQSRLGVVGILLVLWTVAFITFVHMIEAYVLNPRIYGAHLRMNPVLVLAILVISHHIFGLWGLILGVPVTTYIHQHIVLGMGMNKRDDDGDDALDPPGSPDAEGVGVGASA